MACGSTGGGSSGGGSSQSTLRGAGAAMARDCCRSGRMLQPEPTFRPPSRRGDNDDVERVSAASREVDPATSEAAGHALTAFAAAALELVRGESADPGLRALARAVALGTGAELVVARVAVEGNGLVARAVHSESVALAAELEGT